MQQVLEYIIEFCSPGYLGEETTGKTSVLKNSSKKKNSKYAKSDKDADKSTRTTLEDGEDDDGGRFSFGNKRKFERGFSFGSAGNDTDYRQEFYGTKLLNASVITRNDIRRAFI